jgi:hypothetical protein
MRCAETTRKVQEKNMYVFANNMLRTHSTGTEAVRWKKRRGREEETLLQRSGVGESVRDGDKEMLAGRGFVLTREEAEN